MANLEFLRRGAPNLKGATTNDLTKFCRKWHENEEIWYERGQGGSTSSMIVTVGLPSHVINISIYLQGF